MTLNEKTILMHELIGLKVEVVNSSNAANIGICGTVIDETKNTIKIKTSKGIKTIPKEGNEFIFILPNEMKIKIKGERLKKRPEERLKIKVKKW
ncbi:MAG: ribonuclease P protein component 1 [Candidatus Aenigmatarchaeota archaeon]|nr:ribonuclease P protein component 1 [Candidatus Aenigmarchaeota archaeon]